MKNGLVRILLGVAIISLFVSGFVACNSESDNAKKDGKILVSAAISLKESFDEIATAYKKKTGTKVEISYGASGTLAQQIINTAPVDIFASAGEQEMNSLQEKNLLLENSVKIFAGNSLVEIANKSVDDEETGEIEQILIGNPSTVPAGRYTIESLKKSGSFEEVKGKLIFADNIRQVLDGVAQGNVDIGYVYLTDAEISKSSVKIISKVSNDLHSPIRYPIAAIKGGKNSEAALDFIEFVTSEEGQAIIQKYGFTNPEAQ